MLAFVLWVEAEGKEEEKTGEAWANAVSLHCLSGFCNPCVASLKASSPFLRPVFCLVHLADGDGDCRKTEYSVHIMLFCWFSCSGRGN